MRRAHLGLVFLLVSISAMQARAQLTSAGNDAIRLTVSQNADGSRTAYETDPANRRAIATTTGRDGKTIGSVRYTLDAAGRYATGEVLDPKGEFRFRTAYKYDEVSGKLVEETQSTKDGKLSLRLVYAYDANGRPAGYSVYDGSGKLVGQTTRKR
jgi:Flp pilus assembly protein TadG